MKRPRAHALLLALAVVPWLSGCLLFNLKEQLQEVDARVHYLRGELEADAPLESAVIVVLCRPDGEGGWTVYDYRLRYRLGGFDLTLTDAESTRIIAFEDLDSNGDLDPNERIDFVDIDEFEPDVTPFTLRLVAPTESTRIERIDLAVRLDPSALSTTRMNSGVVVESLDDPRFDFENGELGAWKPIEWGNKRLSGVYFLEEYDPRKTPIVCVHGIAGTPRNFAGLARRIDRERFQLWLVYYPSVYRLGFIADHMADMIQELRARYQVTRMGLVAHSMGGLVSQAVLQDLEDKGRVDFFRVFVTIATPWGGHAAAKSGVENAPVVAPVWYDMNPDSPFIENLHARGLPSSIEEYHLLFAFDGDSLLIAGCDDGAAALSSQLDQRPQARATRIWGFDENHVSVLDADPALDRVLEALEVVAPPTTPE